MVATRERALSEREFELLLEGAGRISDIQRRLETRAAILIGGRLGLRPGETTHLIASWVDKERQMIQIPLHEACLKGRDGGICGYCRQAVKQRLDYRSNTKFQKLAKDYWTPKTEAASRTIPYHFSYRVRIAVELLLEEHGGWPYSFSTLQRRLETALELSPELAPDATSLHGLRATAASYHAGRGLDLPALQAMFGWEDIATARQYLNIDGAMTRRALDSVH
ncbi:tyrosine-type recombinase/integrase [Halomarina oriensis]|uniref:Tyrosine-type recombinase/integrase n=1 Tax=Halomarina oriensis TaxID=671145 RepID=A0A6B0GKR8_9EURY|nr:tyrosine-type recombinase/integrase [Halomarina oriensis]MWG34029.1 tyrosine-type recombinase/integrase [Halomarina oriensis]